MKNIFDKDTLHLIRLPFSFFLMPVYCLALSQSEIADDESQLNAFLVFMVLHLCIYPACYSYDSFMNHSEKAAEEPGNPSKANRNVLYVSIVFDIAGLIISWIIGFDFFVGILVYILFSKAYSWKGIRLKKYPVISIVSVMLFQGAITFLNIYTGINTADPMDVIFSGLVYPMIASSLIIGGMYPLTQIYQYGQDNATGDTSVTHLLGYKGTFIFSAIMLLSAAAILFMYFSDIEFMIFALFFSPVAAYFIWWFVRVAQNTASANYENTMHMNLLASVCLNAGFLVIFIVNRLA